MSDMQKEIYEGWRIEILKSQLFDWGRDYIEEFVGMELVPDCDKDDIDDLMDEAIAQMPEEELEVFMEKFGVDKIMRERMDMAHQREEEKAIKDAAHKAFISSVCDFSGWWQDDFPTDIEFETLEELLALDDNDIDEAINDWVYWVHDGFVARTCENLCIDPYNIPEDKIEFVERINEAVKNALREKLYIWKDTKEADAELEKLMGNCRDDR